MSVGMVIMRPTSIVVAGGGSETASIRAAGGVEFSAATSLSLNGVFTGDYDNYMISIRHVANDNVDFRLRFRASATDATGSNYTKQQLSANGTTVSAARTTSNTSADIGVTSSAQRSGVQVFLYGPYLAQPTAGRSLDSNGYLDAFMVDEAFTHSLSTSYDGITVYPSSDNITGMITVYGYAQ